MTLPEATAYLRRYQAWRTGKDDRHFNDTGLTPENIGNAIDTILAQLPVIEKQLSSTRSQLAKCQVQREKFHLQLRRQSKQ